MLLTMRLLSLSLIVVSIVLTINTIAGEVEGQNDFFLTDRFALWNGCKPIRLFDYIVWNDELEGTRNSSRREAVTLVRSRLRAARIYEPDKDAITNSYLKLSVVHSRNGAFYLSINFNKWLYDSASDYWFWATTWSRTTGGTSAVFEHIRLELDKFTDQFVDEFLRVNEEVCSP